MIILDTNVMSELMRSPSAGPVAAWIGSLPVSSLAITAITLAEILQGIRRLPDGRRRSELSDKFADFMDRGFHDRVLAFDGAAADAYAAIVVERQRRGRPIGPFDAMIAGIALSQGADIATRDATGFAGCGITIIDPWR